MPACVTARKGCTPKCRWSQSITPRGCAISRKSSDKYTVKPQLKELVQFDFHNLKTEFLPRRNDIILCRNVMIYFDEAEQKRLIEKFWHCLNPGGYLFVGHAESLFGLTQKFRMVHENNGTAYKRLEVEFLSFLARRSQARSFARSSSRAPRNCCRPSTKPGLSSKSIPADEELIRSVRRAVHTLKGDSAACGFHKLSEIAHELEDVLTLQIGSDARRPNLRKWSLPPPILLKPC